MASIIVHKPCTISEDTRVCNSAWVLNLNNQDYGWIIRWWWIFFGSEIGRKEKEAWFGYDEFWYCYGGEVVDGIYEGLKENDTRG